MNFLWSERQLALRDSAIEFARRTGKCAHIGALEDARRVFEGRSGTRITTEISGITEYPVEADSGH